MKKRTVNKKIFKILGQNIQKQRKKINITLDEFSERTKIRKSYLIKIEKGEAYGLTTTKFFKIAEALEIRPHLLAEGL